jgi:DNA-binding NarL/FixJ family response regulator
MTREFEPGCDIAPETVRVLLVVENRLMREVLARILSKKPDMQVVNALESFPDKLDQLAELKADVVVLDGVNARLGDPRVAPEVSEAARHMKVIIIGVEEDEVLFLRAVQAGVVGYIAQNASALEVLAAVRTVMQDEVVCPPRLCRFLFRHVAQTRERSLEDDAHPPQFSFTRREQQLLPLIAQGLTNKEIAVHFNLSEQTVKNHIHSILKKAGSKDRLRAVRICRAQGWAI